jgi:SagB-type dehydrogenase family enzyme
MQEIAPHATAGYVCAALALVHLALNRRQIAAFARQRLGRRDHQEKPRGEPPRRNPSVNRRRLVISGLSAAGGYALGRLVAGGSGEAALPYDSSDLGELYHRWSKPGHSRELGPAPDWGGRVERIKSYPGAERVALPTPRGYTDSGVEETIEARRSVRQYTGELLPLASLSGLLHAAQGVTAPRRGLRAVPSAGATYPLELYAIVRHVDGLEPGIYHYVVQDHEMELVQAGDFGGAVAQAGLHQGFLATANVCFVLSAVFQRTRRRYHERAYRYVLLEVGHAGQNLYLAATAMGLGSCAVGAFADDALNDLLGLDGEKEAALYIVSVGTI